MKGTRNCGIFQERAGRISQSGGWHPMMTTLSFGTRYTLDFGLFLGMNGVGRCCLLMPFSLGDFQGAVNVANEDE